MATAETLHAEGGMTPDEWWDRIIRSAAERYSNIDLAMEYIQHQFDEKESLYDVLARQKMLSDARTALHGERSRIRNEAEREAAGQRAPGPASRNSRARVQDRATEARHKIMDRYTVGDRFLQDCTAEYLEPYVGKHLGQAEGSYQKYVFLHSLVEQLPDEDTPVGEFFTEREIAHLLARARQKSLMDV